VATDSPTHTYNPFEILRLIEGAILILRGAARLTKELKAFK